MRYMGFFGYRMCSFDKKVMHSLDLNLNTIFNFIETKDLFLHIW